MGSSLAMNGIFTGIDSSVLVAATMEKNRQPLYRLQDQQADWDAQKAAVEDLKQRLGTFKSLITGISNVDNMDLTNASSSDHTVIGASSSAGASVGSYNIEVNKLATSERKVHDGLAQQDQALGGGVFSYIYDGQQRSITLAADETLEDLRDRINDDDANPGVNASILEYDDGAGGVYHLVLSGSEVGSDYTIDVAPETTLADFDTASGKWAVTQAAQDSEFRIDGYPSGDWITRSTNQISDVIEGVSLNFRTVGSETITVERDNGKLIQDVGNMVDAYNSMKNKIDELTEYSSETESFGVMKKDSTLRSLLQKLREPLTNIMQGFSDSSDSIIHPAQLGIEIDKAEVDSQGNVVISTGGQMSFDKETFTQALEDDYDGVLEALGAVKSAVVGDSDHFSVSATSSDTQPGEYEVKAEFDGLGNITAGWFRNKGETEWRKANVDGNLISGKNDTPENDMFVKVVWDGSSSELTSDIRIRQGIAAEMTSVIDEVTNYSTGLITIKLESIEKGIADTEKRVQRMQDRMERLQQSLEEEYARMEAALTALESQKSSVQALVSAMDANSSDDD